MTQRYTFIVIASLTLSGCFKFGVQSVASTSGFQAAASSESLSDTKTLAVIEGTEAVTLSVADNNRLAGTSVVFPAGSLAVSTSIIIEQGADLADTSMKNDIALAADIQITQAGSGVIIRPSESVTLAKPLQLSLPLPTMGLRLAATQYAIYFRQFDPATNQLVSGIKLVDNVDVKLIYDTVSQRDRIQFSGYFGIFWVVALNREVQKSEIPPVVVASEAIVNKANTSVITSSGIVKEAEVASIQSQPELVWPTPSIRFLTDSRSVEVTIVSPSNFSVKDCKIDLFESVSDKNSLTFPAPVIASTLIKIEKPTAHSLSSRFRCIDSFGRVSLSPRSKLIDITQIASDTVGVNNPGALPPTSTLPAPTPTPTTPPMPAPAIPTGPAPDIIVVSNIITKIPYTISPSTIGATWWEWSVVSGNPSSVVFSNPGSASTSVYATVDGNYTLRLTAKSADGATSSREVALTWDTTPPIFGGLSNVMPRYELGGAWLFWRGAIDLHTSTNDIVYEICLQTTSGACASNFNVSIETAAGAWDRRIQALNPSYNYSFVVRARDLAGNVDSNVVEMGMLPLTSISKIYNGYYHTCAILSDKTVRCWGENSSGQLGDGSLIPKYRPVTVFGLTNVEELALGDSHSCARLTSGTVKCWGRNSSSALGNNSATDSSFPVDVSNISTATSIAAGTEHTCASLADKSVVCWGRNQFGQSSGSGSSQYQLPFAVASLTNVESVAAGDNFTCALLSSGQINCWGENSYGQLGDGSVLHRGSPVSVQTISNATKISLGRDSSCALLSTGSINCWGYNQVGQLGNNAPTQNPVTSPVAVSGISTGSSVAVGMAHACALLNDGTVKCWGHGSWGQLGNGVRANDASPQSVLNITSSSMISTRGTASCAVVSGEAKCWGSNETGQLGLGMSSATANPVGVSGLQGAATVTLGYDFGCASLLDGSVRCWGNGSSGQLGDGNSSSSVMPVPVSNLSSVQSLSATTSDACALKTNGEVYCWGSGAITPSLISGINASSISSANSHSCVVISGDKTVKCWGSNWAGQLGDGTTVDHATPELVSNLSNVKSVSTWQDGGCALIYDGSIRCWGSSNLGNGMTSSLVPVTVATISDATVISSGYAHSCAYSVAANHVYCWNQNYTPLIVIGTENTTAITIGIGHSCVLKSDKTVACWGSNSRGQLGSLGMNWSASAIPVPALSGVVSISSAGNGSATCAVTDKGQTLCFGDSDFGQFGEVLSGLTSPRSSVVAP